MKLASRDTSASASLASTGRLAFDFCSWHECDYVVAAGDVAPDAAVLRAHLGSSAHNAAIQMLGCASFNGEPEQLSYSPQSCLGER